MPPTDMLAYLEAYDEHCRKQLGQPNAAPGVGICTILERCAAQLLGHAVQPEDTKPSVRAEDDAET